MSTLCAPATATSRARFTPSCPTMSEKSASPGGAAASSASRSTGGAAPQPPASTCATASASDAAAIHLEPRHQRGLRRVAGRQHEAAHAAPLQALRQGERSGDGPQAAVEPELADGGQRAAAVGAVAHLPGGEQERERDGQVERRPFLADVRRGQVDGDAPRGELVGRVDDRGAHPLPALLHGRVGQPHDAERRRRGDHVGLDHHRVTLEAAQGLTRDSREHGCLPRRPAAGGGRSRLLIRRA